jgi:hypothetical protein
MKPKLTKPESSAQPEQIGKGGVSTEAYEKLHLIYDSLAAVHTLLLETNHWAEAGHAMRPALEEFKQFLEAHLD